MTNEIAILALLLAFAGALGYLFRMVNISPTAGYVITGIAFGTVLHMISPNSSLLQFFSSLAIVVIAFEIGISLKWEYLKSDLPKILLIIIIETLIVGLGTFLIARLLVLDLGSSLAIIFTAINTSTAITFKFLEERGLLSITKIRNLLLGLASMEDIVSLFELSIYPILVEKSNPISMITTLNYILLSLLSAGLLGFLFIRKIFKRSIRFGTDLGILLTMSVLMLSIVISPLFNISAALLALIFGISFSMEREADEILNNIKPFGELFYAIFFVTVGTEVPALPNIIGIAEIILMITVIITLKFFGTIISIAITGVSIKDTILLSLYLLPISEFGIVIAAFGFENGFVTQLSYLGIILTVVSSYIVTSILIRYDKNIVNFLNTYTPSFIENFFKRLSFLQEELTKGNETFRDLATRVVKEEINLFIPIVVTAYLLLTTVYLLYVYGFTTALKLIGSPIALTINILPIYFALIGIREVPKMFRILDEKIPKIVGIATSVIIYIFNVILAFLISVTISNTVLSISQSALDYPIAGIIAIIAIVIISIITYRYIEREVRRD